MFYISKIGKKKPIWKGDYLFLEVKKKYTWQKIWKNKITTFKGEGQESSQ